MSRSGRATIKEVALQAGVSTQTVSRVLNDRPDVAPETRKRVKEVIEQLGYRPSLLARSLSQRRSYTLGVVTAGLKYFGPSRTLNGITQAAETSGYSLLLEELARFDADNTHDLLHSLLANQVDGVIWAVPEIGSNREWIQEQMPGLPVPIVFLTMAVQPGISIVSVDNYLGGCLATQHLCEQGYRHIGHIAGPLEWWEARQRMAGWRDTLIQAGLPVVEAGWAEGNWSSASGERAFLQLLGHYPQVDALFVANDQMALGTMYAAYRQGLRIPQDLAVVGFDNLAESAYFWPPLTTVHQDQERVGSAAVQTVVGLIEAARQDQPATQPQVILLPPELVIRDSSRR
jgi:DNA-binding LacI/PurR family transcriptional regulator